MFVAATDREPAEWVWQAGRADTLEDRLRRATTWEETMRRGADGSGRKLARQSAVQGELVGEQRSKGGPREG